jgi:hypothetical protein
LRKVWGMLGAVLLLTALFSSAAFADVGTGNKQLDQLLHNKSTLSNPISVGNATSTMNNIKQDIKVVTNSTEVTAIDITVFFWILGWAILIISIGLKHPEYQKWGRTVIFTSILAFICIRLGPIIFYHL